MAAVEKVRQIHIEHPKFFESPRCVEPLKIFMSTQQMDANDPLGLEYTQTTAITRPISWFLKVTCISQI